jgi:hypothetical protein
MGLGIAIAEIFEPLAQTSRVRGVQQHPSVTAAVIVLLACPPRGRGVRSARGAADPVVSG